ncbi:MAG: Ig-like domain-containing protein, partial [SAR324 cluster bacterium]|nr:Ig-like domain-containing protein [SAR324 cluster bacterium]
SSINPGNNDSDVDENSEVSVTFSEAMEQGSINSATFIVSIGGEHIDGAITTTSTKGVFKASKGLGSGKEHRVSLKLDEITDLAGNPLETSLLGDTRYFTTKDSTPPTVVSISPKDNSESVRIDTEIEIKFSESIDKDSLTTNGCSGSLKISPSDDLQKCLKISGSYWNSDQNLLALSIDNMSFDTTYVIKIDKTLKDSSNNSIQEAFSSQFKTEPENNDSTDAVSETNSSRGCSFSTSLSDNNTAIKFNKIYSDWKGSAQQVAQDEECGFVVSGNSSSKAWFAKVDKEGEPRGQKSYDFSAPFGGPDAMIKTSDGGYLSAFSHGLIKVDKELNFKWKNTKKLHGQIPPYYKDVIESSDGFYAVTEWHGEKGPALVKISKQGKIQKTVRYPSSCKFNDLNALVETDDGDLIMSGSVVHGNSGYKCSFSWLTNLWILKVNKSGKVKWQKSYGCIPKGKKCSHNWEEANEIIKTDGGYAVVGNKHNYTSNPNKVLWFMKIN